MKRKTVEDLKREEALILSWIRDVTALKEARLREIRSKIEGLLLIGSEKTESDELGKSN